MTDRSPSRIQPLQPLAPGVHVLTTLRTGGVSEGVYASLNVAMHVGDATEAVSANRERIRGAFALPGEPLWLEQIHGTHIARVGSSPPGSPPVADGAVTVHAGRVLAVMTADCLPVVLAAADGQALAIAHAGWRGLAAGVLDAALAALGTPAGQVTAWIGPGIGARHYEVDARVRRAFEALPGSGHAFAKGRDPQHWYCDLPELAARFLRAAGVERVMLSGLCTFSDPGRFFSYRRGGETGRMATLAWLEG